MITQERLKELFTLDEETGKFYWIKEKAPSGWATKEGRAAGFLSDGYNRIKADKKSYLAHRLVWLWFYGEFPNSNLDHKDENKLNNRLDNLRLATGSENVMNVGLKANNTSGAKGVFWNKSSGKWQVAITANGKQKHFGYFIDKDEAIAASIKAREKLHGEFCNHGN